MKNKKPPKKSVEPSGMSVRASGMSVEPYVKSFVSPQIS